MPMPRVARRISTRYASPLMLHLSGRLPGFATLRHVGRSTGREYRSPINVFFDAEQATFALTYGEDAHWVLNVVAAGHCSIETRGRTIELTDPMVVTDNTRSLVPALVRLPLGWIRVDRFLVMTIADQQT